MLDKIDLEKPIISISSVPFGAEAFVISALKKQIHKPFLFVTTSQEKAVLLTQQLKCLLPQESILHLPAWDCLPYDRLSPSPDITTTRIDVLTQMPSASIVVVSAASFLQRLGPKLLTASQVIHKGGQIKRDTLIQALIDNGYTRCETVREAGEYAVRGGILDFFPVGFEDPVRVDFFGDSIEELRRFNALSQISEGSYDSIVLRPSSEILLTDETITTFRTRFREHFGAVQSLLYEAISQGRKHPGMEHFLPLFYDNLATAMDYMPPSTHLILDYQIEGAFKDFLQLADDYYHARQQRIPGDRAQPYYPLEPQDLYLTLTDLEEIQSTYPCVNLHHFQQAGAIDIQGKAGHDFTLARRQGTVFETLKEVLQEAKSQILIACMSDGSRDRLHHLLNEHGIELNSYDTFPPKDAPHGLMVYPLEHGFALPHLLLISEQDLLGDRLERTPPKKRKNEDFFLEASQLSLGDLIVHRDHGIGRYEGLTPITINNAVHDCLMLIYDGDDKLFLPVENIELITRYGNDASTAQLDRLGAAGWQNRKARVKNRILEIAEYLMKLAAERSLHKGEIITYATGEFEEFCAHFPYSETDDQLRAITETLGDMSSGKPMDRLICGDVGFGKTEVALRAAFATVSSGKQVAIIVPTTLLCRQHYLNFTQRFQGFPYRVAQLSRFVKPKEAAQIRRDLAEGKVNIIIATHALFADSIRFSDLGLMIVDEEQHFGVKQKEKLKQLQKDVHVLTLTATPIPRTLQLALTGVREMSLIATPPIDRLAVRTFVMPFDSLTIREAILREYYRGGQVFYVSPRLEGLAELHETLKELVPEVKIAIAHGQMPSNDLEDVITAFYQKEFDVLLSTNIVESGIDIVNANTLIVHRADLLGLAQLYQLRGRVGRAKTQGYAYLTLRPDQTLSTNAQKRLEIMQTLDTLGAGFTLASHDMDIRGTGNIVGEAQSGHIREVGVELYQQLLQEAVLSLRLEEELPAGQKTNDWTPQINIGMSVMIPETFVPDLGVRLGLYRRLSSLSSRAEIDAFAAEIIDRFGKLPPEVKNLFETIELKALCRQAGIEKLDAGPKGLVVTFRNNEFRNPAKLMDYLQQKTTVAKVRPDQKIVFMRTWDEAAQRLKGTKIICRNLATLSGG